jgi:hypothetical protein
MVRDFFSGKIEIASYEHAGQAFFVARSRSGLITQAFPSADTARFVASLIDEHVELQLRILDLDAEEFEAVWAEKTELAEYLNKACRLAASFYMRVKGIPPLDGDIVAKVKALPRGKAEDLRVWSVNAGDAVYFLTLSDDQELPEQWYQDLDEVTLGNAPFV